MDNITKTLTRLTGIEFTGDKHSAHYTYGSPWMDSRGKTKLGPHSCFIDAAPVGDRFVVEARDENKGVTKRLTGSLDEIVEFVKVKVANHVVT